FLGERLAEALLEGGAEGPGGPGCVEKQEQEVFLLLELEILARARVLDHAAVVQGAQHQFGPAGGQQGGEVCHDGPLREDVLSSAELLLLRAAAPPHPEQPRSLDPLLPSPVTVPPPPTRSSP